MGKALGLLLMLFLFMAGKVLSTDSMSLTPLPDMKTLKYILINRDPILKEYSPYPLKLINYTMPQTIVYTRSLLSITIPISLSELVFQYISLNSSEFSIKTMPKLLKKYDSSIILDIYFTPIFSGLRSEYLAIVTNSDFFVYFLQGFAKYSEFGLQTVNIEYFQGTYGVADVLVYNPEKKKLAVVVGKSKNKEFSIEKVKAKISPFTKSEICTIRVYYKELGEYFTYLEILIENYKFFLPVYTKVLAVGLEFPEKIDFGILSAKGIEFHNWLPVINNNKHSISIIRIFCDSEKLKITKLLTKVPGYAKNSKIAKLSFLSNDEGPHVFFLTIVTSDKNFTIECKALVVYSLITVNSSPLVYNPLSFVSYNIEITNNLSHEIFIEKSNFDSQILNVSGLVKLYPKKTQNIEVKINAKESSVQFIELMSSLGKIQMPLMIQDPVLLFFYHNITNFVEICGPINLGYTAYENPVILKLKIYNPNSFDIIVNSAESFFMSKIEYFENKTLKSFESIDLTVTIKSDKTILNPIVFNTSIGSFFISVQLVVVLGSGKVKPIHFSQVSSNNPKEHFLYFTNKFPVPIQILKIYSG